MAAETVRVYGLAQVNRAFAKIDRELASEVRRELKNVAEPVAETARGIIGRFPGAITNTIQPVTSTRSVFIRQGVGKRGGLRSDFGVLQMRSMLGALYEHADDIEPALEEMLDRLGREAGF